MLQFAFAVTIGRVAELDEVKILLIKTRSLVT
jgi:hypothetical protein